MANRKRIIFVDDEQNVLNGLRRMLRSQKDEWDMAFAKSGPEALEVMEQERFDVVVTDVRMPGMDGVELLHEVMKRYPNIVRIVLSGQADQEKIIQGIGPVHQYLSKPCEAETLKSTLSRAFVLQNLLANDEIKLLISRLKSLPSLPKFYNELMAELQSPEPSIKNIGKIIAQDMGMTAKILQLVNSAFFGLGHKITDVTRAVSFLGLETIKSLVLSIHLFSQFDDTTLQGLSLGRLWNHSTTVANLAKQICRLEKLEHKLTNEAYVAGLLHDVGKLVLAANFNQEYSEVIALSYRKEIILFEAEKEVLGATHAEVGAYLLGLWGLPDKVVSSLCFHHTPWEYPDDTFNPVAAVYIANVLEQGEQVLTNGIIPELDVDFLKKLNIEDRIPEWRNLLHETAEED